MRRREVIPLVLVGLAMATATDVRANAPADQYDLFMANDDTIVDVKTRLRWMRFVDRELKLNQALAIQHCAELTDSGKSWRLPSYKELLTLVDDFPHAEYENGGVVSKAIDGAAFPGTPPGQFWSSTTPAQPSTEGYYVDFGTGAAGRIGVDQGLLVRCVQDK